MVDNVCEQMGNFSRNYKKNQIKMLEIKKKKSEVENSFGFNRRLNTINAGISKLEDRSRKVTHTDPKRRRMQNIKQRISNLWITIKTIYHICNWSPRKRRERERIGQKIPED